MRFGLMDFYLVRHGEARPEEEDPKRPLSDRGREAVERVASAAARRGVAVSRIFHSDKVRARETAEILARHLAPTDGLAEISGLRPEDDPLVARAELESAERPVMLVGHLPHLGRLASLLATGNPDKEVVHFPAGALACLSLEDGTWKVRWTLEPASAERRPESPS